MELYFFSIDGIWNVDVDTIQGEIPAVLNDMVKDAINDAVNKFERKCHED